MALPIRRTNDVPDTARESPTLVDGGTPAQSFDALVHRQVVMPPRGV